MFSSVLCLRSTFFPRDPPQSRRTCSLIHVSVLRLFFSSLVFQVTLLTLVSPRFLSARGSSFPLLSPQPCSPTSYSILMERCPPGTFTPLRHFQIQRVWYRLSFTNIHASVTVVDLDFVRDHHRHRVHELLRPHCCLLLLSIFLSIRHILFSTLFLACSSSAQSLPRTREPSITSQRFPLFASLRLRSPLNTRDTFLKLLCFAFEVRLLDRLLLLLSLTLRLLDRCRMQASPSRTVCSRSVSLHSSRSSLEQTSESL